MLNAALTGNVAAGKSVVAAMFRQWGATLLDADEIVADLQQPGQPVLLEIVKTFGENILTADGQLNRAALRAAILNNEASREKLNRIVHPAVATRRNELAEKARVRGDCILVSDIPLLFEAMDPSAFDVVVLVDAPTKVRKERLIRHRGLRETEADQLIATQMPSETKRLASDFIIDNSTDLSSLKEAAEQTWKAMRSQAAEKDSPLKSLVAICSTTNLLLLTGTLARLREGGTKIHLLVKETRSLRGVVNRLREDLGVNVDDTSEALDASAVGTFVDLVGPQIVVTAMDHWPPSISETTHLGTNSIFDVIATPEEPQLEGPHVAVDVRPWLEIKRQVAHTLTECGGRQDNSFGEREYFRWFGSTQPEDSPFWRAFQPA